MTKDSFGWTNWTGLRKNDPQSLAAEIEKIKKWQRTHSGIDFSAAGPDYPHPSQKVRTLLFFEGNGRLDPTGIQIIGDPNSARGIYWLLEFSEDPGNATPGSEIVTDITTEYVSLRNEALLDATHMSRAQFNANSLSLGPSSYVVSVTDGVYSSDVALRVNESSGQRYFIVDDAALFLFGVTSDFPSLIDGMLWYRSDTDKFRARINGVTENLATESYVATATNKQPFAAKTTTYTTTANDGVITVDATSASFTVTLVSAVGNAGLTQTFKKINATNVVTIDANGSQTIDGLTTYALSAQWSWVTLVSNGSNWLITGAG